MKKAIEHFASRTRLAGLLTLLVLAAGALGLLSLKRESLPPVDFGSVIITTPYPGASPEEVEDLVTLKIEDELRGIDGIEEVSSVSRPGMSQIIIKMSLDEADTDVTADEIQRAVLRVSELPPDLPAQPRVVRLKSGQIPVFAVALTGGCQQGIDAAAEEVQDILEDVPGVASVGLYGYSPREFTVRLDSARMNARHIALREVTDALSRQLRDIPGGYLKSNGREVLVRARGKIRTAADAEALIVRGRVDGGAVRIKDIGRVEDGRAEPATLARLDGCSAVLLSVVKQNGADTIEVAGDLRRALERARARLPETVSLRVYDDESQRVGARLRVVSNNAWTGLALILVVLMAMLPGTIGLMAAASLPVSVLALVAIMNALGFSFNVITMISIVIMLGLFIDNSAVVAEAYGRFRLLGVENRAAAARAAAVFFVPLLATVMTNIAGFAPLLVTTGVMGQFVFSIPVVITAALLFSLFETFFLLPARLKFSLGSVKGPGLGADSLEAGWFGGLQRRFRGLISLLILRRYSVLAATTVLMLSALAVAVFLNRFDLFPKERTERYTARLEAPEGTTLEKTDRLAAGLSTKIAEELKRGGVTFESITAMTGSSQTDPDDPQGKVGHNAGLITINVAQEEADRLSTQKVLDLLRGISDPGLSRLTFEAAVAGPPVGPPLNVIFRSRDEEQLTAFVGEFKSRMAGLPAVRNLADDLDRGPEELRLELDNDLLRRAGFSTSEVGAAIQTALQGLVVSRVNIRSREVEVRVRLRDGDRDDVSSIGDIRLLTPAETLMPLKNLARISLAGGPVTRKRFDFQRAVTVSADVDPRRMSALELNSAARAALAEIRDRYPAVSTLNGGEEENTRESLRSLFGALVISVLVILFILVVLNDSFGKALLILSTIPLGLAGVSYVFWLAGRPLSFMALIGVIGLGGVIVNAAIVLVSFIDSARKERPGTPVAETVAEVSAVRFKAVLVTNLTTIMGLLPTAYGFGGEDPLLVPLSLAMGWGLLAGSALSVAWVPCGYMILQDIYSAVDRRFPSLRGGNGVKAGQG